MHWRMFDAAWFARHQRTLLVLLNAPVLGRWLRWVLCLTRHDVGYRRRITRLLPHAYEVTNDDGSRTLDVRTHPKYAKRLYYGFAWLWWTLHAWDQVIANPLIPALNAGFDTLTVYPDPGNPGTTSCDGIVQRNVAGESWATIIAGAGTFASANVGVFYVSISSAGTSNQWADNVRLVLSFDASAMGPAEVSAAELSVAASGKFDSLGISPTYDVYTATPASKTSLAASDYGNVGATSQTGSAKAYADFVTDSSTYNTFTFDATGRANVTNAVVSFSIRNANYDVAAVAPTWSSATTTRLALVEADAAGTTTDPKLVVTYTPQGRKRVTLDQNRISAVANFTNSASTSLAFSSAVSAGQLLTLTFTSGSSNGSSGVQLSTVNDSVNSTGRWQRAVRQRSTVAASSLGAEIWYLAGSSAGTPTVTLTLASTAAGRFLYGIQSWSNASTNATDVLGTTVSTAANSSLCALPTMSSLSSGSVLVTVYKTLAGVTNGANPSGWSTLAPQNSTRENSFYLLKTDTTASTATWRITAATQHVVVGAEFRGSTFTPSTAAGRKGDGCGMLRMGVC